MANIQELNLLSRDGLVAMCQKNGISVSMKDTRNLLVLKLLNPVRFGNLPPAPRGADLSPLVQEAMGKPVQTATPPVLSYTNPKYATPSQPVQTVQVQPVQTAKPVEAKPVQTAKPAVKAEWEKVNVKVSSENGVVIAIGNSYRNTKTGQYKYTVSPVVCFKEKEAYASPKADWIRYEVKAGKTVEVWFAVPKTQYSIQTTQKGLVAGLVY